MKGKMVDQEMEIEMEYSFLKVPVEELMRQFRKSKKVLDKSLESILTGMRAEGDITVEEALTRLSSAIAQLESLPDKLSSIHAREVQTLNTVSSRAQHLVERTELLSKSENEKKNVCAGITGTWTELDMEKFSAEREALLSSLDAQKTSKNIWLWNETRLQRIIIDFILREGYYDTANKMIETFNLHDFVDEQVLLESKKLVESLRLKDCSRALRWCAENRRRLAKMGSELPLKLRIQEFVELRRAGKTHEAIAYARAHMTQAVEDAVQLIPEVMTVFAFPPDAKSSPCDALYSEDRWTELVDLMKPTYCEVNGLTTIPLIEIALKVGLSARKTKACFHEDTKNVECPTCTAPFNEMSKALPLCHQIHSKLVCSITGKLMNENNPPMVLLNGNVYSELGLKSIASDGFVIDPETGEKFSFPSDQIEKVYIM